MRFKYVPDGDILMIYLSDEPPFLGEQTGNVIVHTDKQDYPAQLEILDGKKFALDVVECLLDLQKATNP